MTAFLELCATRIHVHGVSLAHAVFTGMQAQM